MAGDRPLRIDPSWMQPAPALPPLHERRPMNPANPGAGYFGGTGEHPSQLTPPGQMSVLERYNQIKNAPPAPPVTPAPMGESERIARAIANPLARAWSALSPIDTLANAAGMKGSVGDQLVSPPPAAQQAEVPAGPPADPMQDATFADRPAPSPVGGGGGGGAVAVVPGGRRTQGWQVQEGLKFSDGTFSTIAAAQEAKERVLTQEAKAGQAAAEREAAFADGYERQLAGRQAEEAAGRERRQKMLDEQFQKLEAANKAAADDGGMTVAGKALGGLMATIGVALGAWGGTMDRTGRNAGAEALQQFTNNAVREQREKADRENNYYARMKDMFGDEKSAELATRAAFNEATQARLAKMAATTKSDYAKANIDRVQQQILADSASLKKEFDIVQQDKVQRTDANVPDRVVGFGGPAAKQSDVEKYGEALSKSGIPEAEQKLAEFQARVNTYQDGPLEGVAGRTALEGTWESAKPDFMLSDAGLANRQLVNQLETEAAHAMSGAGMSDAERALYSRNIRGAKTKAELNRAAQQIQNAIAARKRAIRATYDPRAVSEFDRRTGGSTTTFNQRGIVPTARPAGEK